TAAGGARPYGCWRRVMPPIEPGGRTEPPVSVAVATGARPAATAAAAPPDEPPAMAVVSQGLRTGPKWLFSFAEPIANSSQFVLPRHTAPAAASRSTTVASKGLR